MNTKDGSGIIILSIQYAIVGKISKRTKVRNAKTMARNTRITTSDKFFKVHIDEGLLTAVNTFGNVLNIED